MSHSSLHRRQFIRHLTQASALAFLPGWGSTARAQAAFSGKLLLTVQAQGAWDVTSFCDPKSNVAGEKEINRWARTKSIGTAGNLRYAPFGSNKMFFDKYYGRMLVINGVDMQTNAHETGETAAWSGRLSLGFPSLTALYAASVAPALPLALLHLGGWGNTEDIINSTRVDNPDVLRNVLLPNKDNLNPGLSLIADDDARRIRALYRKQIQAAASEKGRMPQDLVNRGQYQQALEGSEVLEALAAGIPPKDQLKVATRVNATYVSNLFPQIQLAMLAFKSGLCAAANLREGGFDTHDKHDELHEPLLAHLLNGIDYLWDYAEQLGIADRLLVVISSDFGRTPHYNAGDGKDHWPINSYVIMEKNVRYTNRTVGETDGGHNALNIDPVTLQRSKGGTLIYSKHVQKALRRYLGLANTPYDKFFPFNNTEDFRFFG